MSFEYSEFLSFLTKWSMTTGIRIFGILIVSLIIWKLSNILITNIIRKAVKSSHFASKDGEKKREDTLIRVFHSTFVIFLLIIVMTMLLAEVGIETGPLIAIGSIAGVALGFGGQYIIKDFISGFIIISENQYRIGDVICINQTCGLVEDINLRSTILRDLDGTVHHISNGEVKIASNLSKDFAQVNLNVTVTYVTDIDALIKIINDVGKKLAADKEWKDKILEPPQFLRIDDFGQSGVVVKIVGKTIPLMQWDVTAELRKRIKTTFDENSIRFALPQIVVHNPRQ